MDAEETRLLRGSWLPVCRVADVAGDAVLQARVLDVDLVVYSSDGVLTVAEGRCPHRGMALWKGTLCDGQLQCPYHGWLFAPGSGRCTDVPALEPDETPSHVGLRVLPNRVAYGHVWTCLVEPVLPFPELPGWEEGEWALVCGQPREVACGLRQITENFRDLGHLPFVHGSTMRGNVEPRVPRYEVHTDGHAVEWSRLTERLAGDAPAKRLTYRAILPSFTTIRTEVLGIGSRVLAQIATPITADGDRIRLFWFAGVDQRLRESAHINLDELAAYEAKIFAEDVEIVEQCAPAEALLDLRAQAHTRADRFSIAYRRAYLSLLDKVRGEHDDPTYPHPRATIAEALR